MRILILSDTHGTIRRSTAVFEKLSKSGKIDMIFHAGDYDRDADELQNTLAVPVISVRGNCDYCMKRDFKVIAVPSGNVLLTHGHMEGVNRDLNTLRYLAQENGCSTAVFGHTHVPLFLREDDITIINPGSLTYPRDGSHGSCFLMESTRENGLDGTILYYADLFPDEFSREFGTKSRKKKARGGFLRKIINYSDGL